MKKSIKLLIIIIIIVIIKILVLGYFFYIKVLNEAINTNQELIIHIPSGTNMNKAIEIINKQGELKPSVFFKYYIRLYAKKSNKPMLAGYFKFEPGTANRIVVEGLFDTKYFYTTRVTFPEGLILENYAKIIQRELNLDSSKFMRLAKSDSLLNARNIPTNSIEGWLLPDTYTFFKDIDEKGVIAHLLDAQNKIWNAQFALKAEQKGMSRKDVLILASIVDAETPVTSERARVAGVYLNRLKRGMLLQADPTVQYGLKQFRRLLYRDLQINNPYNTYINSGLPPGAINSPAISSIQAVLEPEEHNYLYMVAKGDGSGEHNFSQTYQQHLRYVAEYRSRMKRR